MKYISLIVLSLFSYLAQAELVIEINKGVDNPTPIAIVPFAGSSALPENLQSIVSADLARSGLFAPMPVADMLSMPSTQEDIAFRDWKRGANYLVIGRLVKVPSLAAGVSDLYKLEFELYDVLLQRKLFEGKSSGPLSRLRDMAHAVSDAVYEKITGIRGVFGTKLLYVEDMGRTMNDRYRLVHADADGARDKVLFASSEPILSPSWSNKGDRIAFVSFETRRPAIYVMDLATGQKTQVTNFRGLNGAPAWSPDDRYLAMVLSKDGNPEIYTMELTTRKLRRITRSLAIDTEPAWSVNGKSVIFTSNRGGSPQVYQVGLASGRPERLTFEGDYNARPQPTPDGKGIVMVHREQGVFHIASQDIKTGDMRILTETWLDESPSIAPNGAILMYATQHNRKGVLAAVSMDAGVKFRLPSKRGDVREPAWSPYIK